ncbi:hypothetical protein ACG2LH_16625 [Zhouia sp. PK063]|uniref:hypothetical protein n=1 Tax=Zhouia sp. PK063 TaxID=3373602 RepID=UPI0037B0D65C
MTTEGSSVTTTDYDGNLKFFSNAEGYVDAADSNKYVYQYKDDLGSVRYKNVGTTTTPSLQIQEENNYYLFGLKHEGYNDIKTGWEV